MTDDENAWEPPKEDWHRPKILACPGCGISLLRVNRWPLEEAWRIYCESCPRSVEVAYNDKAVAEVHALYSMAKDLEAFRRELERRLKACDCGGRYRFRAARRCHGCGVVITDEPDVDLFHHPGNELAPEPRNPTAAQRAAYDEWRARFIKTKDLWRPN